MLSSHVQKERVEAISFSLPASSSMHQILDCIIFPSCIGCTSFRDTYTPGSTGDLPV
jgi:hypothetical protein